jgi:hypothetical protein
MIDEAKAEAAKTKKSKEAYENWRQENHDKLPAETSFLDADNKPSGTKMVVFDKNTDPDLAKRNLSQDTKELNTCVGACNMDNGVYIPMVEPHTGVENKAVSRHGPRYLEQLLNGDIKVASLRGPRGESKATLELVPQNRDSSDFRVRQLKGYKNGKLSNEDANLVKNWLNHKWKTNELAPNEISDLENLPGVYDMRNRGLDNLTKDHSELSVDAIHRQYLKKLEGVLDKDPQLKDYFNKGFIHDAEVLQQLMPRFMTKEEILNYLR